MTRAVAPYGTWPSPITPASLVEQAVRLGYASISGDTVYWVEGRPAEAGREVLVRLGPDGPPEDAVPEGFSVHTQVHEYGGRCYAVHLAAGGSDVVVFSNWADQRLYAVTADQPPRPLTAEPDAPRADRFADPVITPDGRWVVCVREHHDDAGGVVNDVVAVALDGVVSDTAASDTGARQPKPRVVAEGHDFYSSPRLSPDGRRLAWISWDHPNMPWDATELWVAEVGPDLTVSAPRLLAGGPGVSVTQPRWSTSGVLHYVSDLGGWWNLYDESGTPLCPMDAEFAEPDWVFGNASYCFTSDGRLVATWSGLGGSRIGIVAEGQAEAVAFPFTSFASLSAQGGDVVALAASPVAPPGVARFDLAGGTYEVLRLSRRVTIVEEHISRPDSVVFPTGGGATAHALVYPPTNRDFEGPADEHPPLVVVIHGGPTSSSPAVFNLAVQYWTNRGFAVADVDYRGSSGYGRAYRRLLDGSWGVADVEDCAAVVAWLGSQGRADGRRAVIRGGSAGGFTTLAALAFTDAFAAGASLFGVADLELLARDTHKFEARYLDGLVGPWPEAAELYRQRSPIHHVDRMDRPLILFQGLEDMVVPPAQSEMMYEALKAKGVPVAYLAFEGEQHGFRQAQTIIAVATAELEFYGRVLGFVPQGTGDFGLEIANEERLSPRV